MADINPNPSPKSAFLRNSSTKEVTAHNDLIVSPLFRRALDAALLEYQRRIASSHGYDAQSAAAASFKIQGALGFVHELTHLGLKPSPPEGSTLAKLDHTV